MQHADTPTHNEPMAAASAATPAPLFNENVMECCGSKSDKAETDTDAAKWVAARPLRNMDEPLV